jgi:hypothetical protein|tara:strand:+ start:145 stop:567 length:423 start_codon:yes stop_codon:yes gene_type:complete
MNLIKRLGSIVTLSGMMLLPITAQSEETKIVVDESLRKVQVNGIVDVSMEDTNGDGLVNEIFVTNLNDKKYEKIIIFMRNTRHIGYNEDGGAIQKYLRSFNVYGCTKKEGCSKTWSNHDVTSYQGWFKQEVEKEWRLLDN